MIRAGNTATYGRHACGRAARRAQGGVKARQTQQRCCRPIASRLHGGGNSGGGKFAMITPTHRSTAPRRGSRSPPSSRTAQLRPVHARTHVCDARLPTMFKTGVQASSVGWWSRSRPAEDRLLAAARDCVQKSCPTIGAEPHQYVCPPSCSRSRRAGG